MTGLSVLRDQRGSFQDILEQPLSPMRVTLLLFLCDILLTASKMETCEMHENSEQAIKLLEEVNNYTTRHYERATGLETWFSLPRLKGASLPSPPPPPRWKMAIVSFIGAYCISLLINSILIFT